MYTINMADSNGLFIVLIIFCVISITSSIFFTYTCTDGTWDFDNFEGEQCVKFPEEDKTDPACSTFTSQTDCPLRCSWDTTTSLCGETSYNYDPSPSTTIPNTASNYDQCYDGMSINDAKTTFNATDNSAGVRWFWSEATKYSGCKSSIGKYRVTVTSSLDNHQQEYYYDVIAGSANSFAFKNAPGGWLSGQNIEFKISALTPSGLLVADTITVELDANESTDDGSLVGVGIPVDFNSMTKVIYGGDPPPPAPDPVNCSGGTWTNLGGCTIDGVTQDMSECGELADQVQVLTGDDIIPASDGGTCVTQRTVPCATVRDSCNEFDETIHTQVIDCKQGEWMTLNPCNKTCGGGKTTEWRDTITDPLNGGTPCGSYMREIDCNTQDCPINCVGNWSFPDLGKIETFGGSGNNGGTKTVVQDGTYIVTQAANPYGTPCAHVNGATKTVRTQVCSKSDGQRKLWKAKSILGIPYPNNCPDMYKKNGAVSEGTNFAKKKNNLI